MQSQKKIAFISGSSSGLGYMIAKKLIEQEFIVIINSDNLFNIRNSSNSFDNIRYIKGDVTREEDVVKIFRQIKKKYRYLDLLICNYGNSDFKKNNFDLQHAINNNLLPSFFCIKHSKNILKKNISKIICISSICGIEKIDGAPIGYSVAKSALNTLVKLYAVVLSKIGVSINAIVPGNIYFEGSLWQKKLSKDKSKINKYIKKNVPINKFGYVDDVFIFIKALLENKSQFITGSVLITDGGQTKRF